MILCFHCKYLSKILLVSKFETNRPNIKLIIAYYLALSVLKVKDHKAMESNYRGNN